VAENKLKVSCEPLKQRFLDMSQNEFLVPGNHLNNRFLDLTKFELLPCQYAEYEFVGTPTYWYTFL